HEKREPGNLLFRRCFDYAILWIATHSMTRRGIRPPFFKFDDSGGILYNMAMKSAKKSRIFNAAATGLLALLGGKALAANECPAPPTGKIGGTADLIINAQTGRVLHERNAHQLIHPASLTKIMTL